MSEEEIIEQEPEQDQETGVTDPDAGGTDQAKEEEPVSREAFIAMRRDLQGKLESLSDQNQLYRTQLALLQQQRPGAKEAGADDPLAGLDNDDVITVGQMRQIMSQVSATMGGSLGEARLAATKPDYEEVVSKHLPNYLQANPEMIQVMKALPPALRPKLAYTLGLQADSYRQGKAKAQLDKGDHPDLSKIRDNQGKPQVGARGSGAPLSKAGYFQQMSDEQLEAHIAKVMTGGAKR